MASKVFNYTNTLATSASLEVVKLAVDLYAYKLIADFHNTTPTGTFTLPNDLLPTAINEQGFVNCKNFKLIKAGKPYKPLNLYIMPFELQEALRLNGWIEWDNEKWSSWAPINVFDAVNEPTFNLKMVVEIKHESHMLADYTGKVLPVGVNFNDNNGGIVDGRYNLNLLLKHLQSRTDCKLFSGIENIPYYNAGAGHRQTISFIWQPNAEDYTKMWEWCLANGRKYPSCEMHQAIFELDLLGTRAVGANKFDTFYGSDDDDC